jgi:FdhE protein
METDLGGYLEQWPDYRESLILVQRLIALQRRMAEMLESDLHIQPDTVRARLAAGQPLLTGERLAPPQPWLEEAATELRALLPADSDAVVVLERLLAEGVSDIWRHADPVTGYQACIQQMVDSAGAEVGLVEFLLTAVLSPFFDTQVAPYRAQIEAVAWRRGSCPACGSEPWMARLVGESGQRRLVCALCQTEWTYDRLGCPFCQSDDQIKRLSGRAPRLRYFTVDGDGAHRAYCCEQCSRYIKTVDERATTSHSINLLAEDVVTARLDQLAREHGFR